MAGIVGIVGRPKLGQRCSVIGVQHGREIWTGLCWRVRRRSFDGGQAPDEPAIPIVRGDFDRAPGILDRRSCFRRVIIYRLDKQTVKCPSAGTQRSAEARSYRQCGIARRGDRLRLRGDGENISHHHLIVETRSRRAPRGTSSGQVQCSVRRAAPSRGNGAHSVSHGVVRKLNPR